MKFKLFGASLAFTGLLLIAKLQLHLVGIVLIVGGVYLAIIKGTRPK